MRGSQEPGDQGAQALGSGEGIGHSPESQGAGLDPKLAQPANPFTILLIMKIIIFSFSSCCHPQIGTLEQPEEPHAVRSASSPPGPPQRLLTSAAHDANTSACGSECWGAVEAGRGQTAQEGTQSASKGRSWIFNPS